MPQAEEIRKKAIVRMDIVQLYMMRNYEAAMYAKLFNAGDISRQLLEEHGAIDAESISRWASACMGIGA